MDSSDEDEAAFIDAFFLPGGILDPEDEEKAKRSEQEESTPSDLFSPSSAADSWLGAATATVSAPTVPSVEVPPAASSENASSWLGQGLTLSAPDDPLLAGNDSNFNTDAAPSTPLPPSTHLETASNRVDFSNLAASGAPDGALDAAPAIQSLSGLDVSTDKPTAAWSQSQWDSEKVASLSTAATALLPSDNQQPLASSKNINLVPKNPPPPPGFNSLPPGFEQIAPVGDSGQTRHTDSAAEKSSKVSAPTKSVAAKVGSGKREQPQRPNNIRSREQKTKADRSTEAFQSVSRGRSKVESRKDDKAHEHHGAPKRTRNNKKKARQIRPSEDLSAPNTGKDVANIEEVEQTTPYPESFGGGADKLNDEGKSNASQASSPVVHKHAEPRSEPIETVGKDVSSEEPGRERESSVEQAHKKQDPAEDERVETQGSEKVSKKQQTAQQKSKDTKVSKSKSSVAKKKESVKEKQDMGSSQNQDGRNEFNAMVNILAPAVTYLWDFVQSVYAIVNHIFMWIREILIPALKQSLLTGTSSALHSLRGILLLLFAAFHTYSFAADETLAELNFESAWIPYVTLVYAPTAARHLMNFVDLPQFTPHIVSSAVLCFLFRRPPANNSKNFSSRATPDDLRNIVLFCCQLLVPIDLLVDGFASVNTGIMTLCYADRLLLAYAICVVRKGWILAPCAWISFAIQFLVATYFPWKHILAEPILLFVLFSMGMASLNILRNLEQLKQRAKKALGKNS